MTREYTGINELNKEPSHKAYTHSNARCKQRKVQVTTDYSMNREYPKIQ